MSDNLPENERENERRWLILRAKIYEEKLKGAFRYFRSNGIEPILIKGWAAARVYPEPFRRVYTDIDFCVKPDFYATSKELIDGEEGNGFNIDLHSGFRHLDTLEWDELFENSQMVMLDDLPIRILCPEDHLRILCVHWLTDGGAYKEKLLDFSYLLKTYEKDFDWERCLGKISRTRRLWIIKTIGVVQKYYDPKLGEVPFEAEIEPLPGWFIKALEKEWASDVRLVPLHTILGNYRELWKQFRKRFPPNPIQATIDLEGEFDESTRIFYQLGSIYIRLKPSLRRIYETLRIKKR